MSVIKILWYRDSCFPDINLAHDNCPCPQIWNIWHWWRCHSRSIQAWTGFHIMWVQSHHHSGSTGLWVCTSNWMISWWGGGNEVKNLWASLVIFVGLLCIWQILCTNLYCVVRSICTIIVDSTPHIIPSVCRLNSTHYKPHFWYLLVYPYLSHVRKQITTPHWAINIIYNIPTTVHLHSMFTDIIWPIGVAIWAKCCCVSAWFQFSSTELT